MQIHTYMTVNCDDVWILGLILCAPCVCVCLCACVCMIMCKSVYALYCNLQRSRESKQASQRT